MDTSHLISKFERIGARAAIRPLVRNRWQPQTGPVVIDVGHDHHGESFDIRADDSANVEVLDVQPNDRHLLLIVRQPAGHSRVSIGSDRLLFYSGRVGMIWV